MLIVSGLLGYLPGADLLLFGRMTIVLLLRFAMALGMAGVLIFVYRHASRLLRQAVVSVFLGGPSTVPLETAAAKVAQNAILLIYVCLLYGIVMSGFEPLAVALTAATWPFTVIRLGCLGAAVLAIVGILAGAPPLFGQAGDALARRVAPPSEPRAAPVHCPGCGVLDDGGSKYCRFCGRLLADESAPPARPPSVTCTRCGGAVTQPARFCPSCGKPV